MRLLKLLKDFERNLNQEYSCELKTRLKQAYLDGYNKRVSEERFFFNNIIVHAGGNDWYRYNYGAVRERDCCHGDDAGGWDLTYNDATHIPYMRLPTKDEFMNLYNSEAVIGKYNLATDGRIWNARVCIGEIKFYESRQGKPCSFTKNLNTPYHSQIWLSEEDGNQALSVAIGLVIDTNSQKAQEYTCKLTPPHFVMIPKESKLNAHFIFDREHINSEWFDLQNTNQSDEKN